MRCGRDQIKITIFVIQSSSYQFANITAKMTGCPTLATKLKYCPAQGFRFRTSQVTNLYSPADISKQTTIIINT